MSAGVLCARQNTILRYGRLQVCATRAVFLGLQSGLCVTQIFNLLYRRLAVGCSSEVLPRRGEIFSALQNTILRYSRLQVCATCLDRRSANIKGRSVSAD